MIAQIYCVTITGYHEDPLFGKLLKFEHSL